MDAAAKARFASSGVAGTPRIAWANKIHAEFRLLRPGVASAVIVAIASTALLYWTFSSLGKNLTDTVVTRRDAVLVTHGPYRWVRHPFYVCAALLMASVTILTANWLIGITSLMVLILLAIRTPKEERMLIQRFGDDYRHYIETTGKFVPRLW